MCWVCPSSQVASWSSEVRAFLQLADPQGDAEARHWAPRLRQGGAFERRSGERRAVAEIVMIA